VSVLKYGLAGSSDRSDSIDDMGYLMGGKIGREIFAIAFWLCESCALTLSAADALLELTILPVHILTPVMIFVGGAGMLSLATALNAISVHGTCTAVFVAVAAVAAGLVASLQTLGKIKWIGWAGVASIMSAGASEVWDDHCGLQVRSSS